MNIFSSILIVALFPTPGVTLALQPETSEDQAASDSQPDPAEPQSPPAPQVTPTPKQKTSPLRPIPVAADGLTADQVARKAVDAAPSVEMKAADIDVADAQIGQTTTSFVPQVGLTGSFTRLSDLEVSLGDGATVGAGSAGLLGVGACPDGSGNQCVLDAAGGPVGAAVFEIPQILNQWNVQAQISVPISDYVLRTYRGLKAAKRSKKAAELSKDAEERKVAIDARVAYYDWLRAKAQVIATEETMRSSASRLEDAKAAFNAGLRTVADVKRMEALVVNAESANVQARGFERLSREQLSVVMNIPVEDWSVGEDVFATVPPASAEALEEAVREAMANRPELESLGLNEQALEDGIKAERAGYYPSLNAFGEVTYANPNQRVFPQLQEWNATWSVGLSLSYTVNGPLMARQNLRQYEGQQRSLNAQEESLRRGIRLEVSQAYIDENVARSRISLAEASRAASDAAYEVVSIQFSAGTATTTDVIDAEGDRLNSFIEDYNARIDLLVAQAKLAYAMGRTKS